jgi:ketosteroid isomerase-like protein
MMSQENVEAATKLVEAFNRADLESFTAFFAPEAEIVPLRAAMENTIFRGPTAAEDFYAATRESWESPRLEIEEIRGAGDVLLVLGAFHARGHASGAEISVNPAWVMRFQDGAITLIHSFADREEAVEAAGLSE